MLCLGKNIRVPQILITLIHKKALGRKFLAALKMRLEPDGLLLEPTVVLSSDSVDALQTLMSDLGLLRTLNATLDYCL